MIREHLHDEHEELRGHIERIREVADMIGSEPTPEIHQGVESVKRFLRMQLLPHAEVEERGLYPVIGDLLGDARSTATMSQDHQVISRYVDELEGLRKRHESSGQSPLIDLRRILYSLHALISHHLEKEESVLIPVLESRLGDTEQAELLESLEAIAAEVFAGIESDSTS